MPNGEQEFGACWETPLRGFRPRRRQGSEKAADELARRRWREFAGARRFQAAKATFVQNTPGNCWLDLAEYALRKT